jgi:hypothetical protein
MNQVQPNRQILLTLTFLKNGVVNKCICKKWLVAGLAWSKDPESYAGGSIATGRGSHAGQVKGDTLVLQVGGWGLGVKADNPSL